MCSNKHEPFDTMTGDVSVLTLAVGVSLRLDKVSTTKHIQHFHMRVALMQISANLRG